MLVSFAVLDHYQKVFERTSCPLEAKAIWSIFLIKISKRAKKTVLNQNMLLFRILIHFLDFLNLVCVVTEIDVNLNIKRKKKSLSSMEFSTRVNQVIEFSVAFDLF